MEFIKTLGQLLHSDHLSEKSKQRRIIRFADAITTKNLFTHRTPGYRLVEGNDLQTLKDFFEVINKYVPHVLGPVLTVTSLDNRTIGHAVARYKDEQGLSIFLHQVQDKLPQEFENVVLAKTGKGWNMGHLIAYYQKGPELKTFFDSVLANAPKAIPDLVNARLDDGRQIIHIIATCQDPQTIDYFFKMLRNYDQRYGTTLYINMLTSPLMNDWHAGYFVAEHQNHESVVNYLNQLVQFAPEKLPELLKATTEKGWNLGHFIAEYQKEETLDYFLKIVIEHAPETLPTILNAREKGPRLLGLLILDRKRDIGPIVYRLISSAQPLGEGMYERLQCFKKPVLEHISRLPVKEQLQLLSECLDKKSVLGLYFDIDQGFIKRHYHKNQELIDIIGSLRAKAEVEMKAQQNNSNRFHKTAEPTTSKKEDAHVEPLADPCDYTTYD